MTSAALVMKLPAKTMTAASPTNCPNKVSNSKAIQLPVAIGDGVITSLLYQTTAAFRHQVVAPKEGFLDRDRSA
ncbi:hypothetical protein DSM3645_15905 [Blastopirellula marina DSM 3645]|uniref:Uncharacterized protein n=1 Tax=Blastopirellula marina DSM 3645 TaxID=314230 RepID=A4A288_9BACT|nr:hypothetical protein DSM3645_15905 [Blastopirellula marina DSM 3645]